jgi:hypothetical protein
MSDNGHNILFLFLAVVVLSYSLVVGTLGMPVPMSISAFLSMALFFFATLDKFSSFKASTTGIEAQMRQVVEKAEGTLEQTRKLAVSLAKQQISMLVRANRFGSYSPEEKAKIWTDIVQQLKEMGVSAAEREQTMADVHRYAKFDLYREIVAPNSRIKDGIPPTLANEYHALSHRDIDDLPSPNLLEDFLKRAGLWTDVEKKAVEDYRHYMLHDKARITLPL